MVRLSQAGLAALALALSFSLAPCRAQPPVDFSYAGYGGGGVAIPAAPAALAVRPTGGDDTELLQGAIDAVGALPAGKNGIRGAVLLRPGRYRVTGQLKMLVDGVVLRGSGNAVIVAAGKRRRTLIEVGGRRNPATAPAVRIVDSTVPAGGQRLELENAAGFQVGDRIVVVRPSTAEWIAALKMHGLPGTFANQRLDWAPGSRNLTWDRVVTQVDRAHNAIALDAPVTTALESRYGGGTVARVESGAPVAQVGIENLTLESEFESPNPRDEDHSWIAIALDHVEDAWVRGVVARHFAGSAVHVGPRGRRITVEACRSEQPVSEPGGYRRQSFLDRGPTGAGAAVCQRKRHERFRRRAAGRGAERVPRFQRQRCARPQRLERKLGFGNALRASADCRRGNPPDERWLPFARRGLDGGELGGVELPGEGD